MDANEFKLFRTSTLCMTQMELSKALHVDVSSISRMERGIIPIDVRTKYSLFWLGRQSESDISCSESKSSDFGWFEYSEKIIRLNEGHSPSSSKRTKNRKRRKNKKMKR